MKAPAVIQEAMDEVAELQIAPLIDCVFQLLIYFMVSASLQRTEADLGIQLPGSMISSKPSQFPEEQVVEIGSDGKVKLNDKVYDAHGQREMPELTATLIRYRLSSQAAKSKAIVTISADDNTVHQRVIDVLNACADAGIKDISFIKQVVMKTRNAFTNYIWYHRGWAGKAITISLAAHLTLLLASGSIIILRARFSPPTQFKMPPPAPRPSLDPHKLEMRAKVQDLSKASSRPKIAPRMVANRPSDIALPDIKKLTDVVSKVKRDYSAVGIQGFGVGIGGGFGTGIGGGMGGGMPHILSGRCDPIQRLKRLQQNGGDSACENTVVRGLKWLASHQNGDGSWGHGQYKCAMTGLALLAFLGHCETPEVGNFTGNVLKAIDYLIRVGEQRDGRLNFSGGNAYPYEHAIATYALAEAYSMTMDTKIEPVLAKAVYIILNGQTGLGGWEYDYKHAGMDMSVTGWNFQALKAAQLTGLKLGDVDGALKRALVGIKNMQDRRSGNWFYKATSPRVSPTLTGVGVLCLAFMKEGRTQPARAGCDAILAHFRGSLRSAPNNYYAWYYSTQGCFQVGGSFWSSWRRVFQKEVIQSQNGDGSWPANEYASHMSPDGSIYATSLSVLMLEVYYRYLPTTQ